MKITFQNQVCTVFESALFRTTCTIIHTSDFVLIIDPNWLPEEIDIIAEYVNQIPSHLARYLLFTHSDYDHIIGYKAFDDVTTIASKFLIENPEKEDIIKQIKAFDDQYYIQRDYDILYPTIDISIIEDGQKLELGTTKFTFYHARGHNYDGIFTIVEPYGIWIAGDYLSNIEFPYVYFSFSAYENTLRSVDDIIKNHDIKLLISGHGDVATSIEEILQRKKASEEYIESLKESTLSGKHFDLEKLWQQYQFPGIMTDFHEKNIELLQKEQGKQQ